MPKKPSARAPPPAVGRSCITSLHLSALRRDVLPLQAILDYIDDGDGVAPVLTRGGTPGAKAINDEIIDL